MRFSRRLFALLAVLLPLLLPFTAPSASAAAGCASSTTTWSIASTNIGLRVGTLHRTETRCWGRYGYLTSASSHAWYVNTTTGSLYGVAVDRGEPYLRYRDKGLYEYGQDFVIRNCFVYIGLFCGPTMDFRIVDQIWAPRLTGWHWTSPFCATNNCASHVRFARTR